jgi:hypothetical protein
MPKAKKISMGIQNHTIFKRYLEDEYGKLRSTQQFLLLSYGVFDWFCVDLKGGAGFIKQHPVGSDEVDYPSNFAGGYGFRARLYDKDKIKMVFGFQHISVHPHAARLGNIKNKAVLDDWQFSGLVSYDFGKVTPYIGTRWSRLDYIHWVEQDRKRRMSDLTKGVGLIFGFDFPLTVKTWLNLEGQLFDSTAFAFSVNFDF